MSAPPGSRFTIGIDGKEPTAVLIPAGATAAQVAEIVGNASGGRVTVLTPEEAARYSATRASYVEAETQRRAERDGQIARLIDWVAGSVLCTADQVTMVRALELLRDVESGDYP